MSNYLVDSNAAIARINGDTNIIPVFESAQTIAIPTIVVGELLFGAENSGRVAENLKQVEAFITGRTILVCDLGTARWYGRVMRQQSVKGQRIPENDTWIAAIALQHSLTVLTRDAHFNDVDGLAVQGW
jgi:tRNA(fMet)-specific endonuclease VapC